MMAHRFARFSAFFVAAVLAANIPLFAQKINPAHWTTEVEGKTVRPGGTVIVKAQVKLDEGWHMYSLTSPKGGGLPLIIGIESKPEVARIDKVRQPQPIKKLDPNFGVETETFEGSPTFYIAVAVAKDAVPGAVELTTKIRYSVCRDTICLPPKRLSEAATITVVANGPKMAGTIPSGGVDVDVANLASASTPSTPDQPASTGPAAQPATASPNATPSRSTGTGSGSGQAADTTGLPTFFLIAFGAGLASIFTPCVFPMIPITLSFFLRREGVTRKQSVSQAAIFCLGIIVLFTALGLLLSAIIGPFAVVQLAANPWVNGFIAAVFLAFGLSLLGAFEITIPSGVLNRMDRAAQGGGIWGTLLMGLTFSLTSFACVGPFVGTLLAASVQQGGFLPVIGMITFSAGLASPFFLLALFPAYLQRLPRSGGWLVRVKIVMGFIVLAAMFKYMSSIDQVLQWNVLTRERFLAIWIVLFALPGLYLLGFLRMEGIDRDQPAGVARVLIGAFFLVFATSLIPGMFGRSLGELDAYVPLGPNASTSGAAASGDTPVWMKNQYREALAKAKAENKLVFINFTGYACTNCHWMKANMFPRPEIAAAMKGFVPVELYTDGTDAASEENQKLQESKFGTIAIPFYAIVSPDEKVVASWSGLQRNPAAFLAFLNTR